jgi:hypothetical protein
MANGTVAASQLEMLTLSGTGVITVVPPNTNTNRTLTLPDSTDTLQTIGGVLTQFNASGSAPVYAARAWVNFNGTGTVAIRASGNVSSITDNGTGDYTVNFATAMPDTSYAAVCTGFVIFDQGSTFGFGPRVTTTSNGASTKTTTQLRVLSRREADYDLGEASVSIFR